MATYTIDITGVCSGGEHVFGNVQRNGVVVRGITLNKSDILSPDELSWEDVIHFFIREVIKKSGATTLIEARNAIEAASWEF